MIYDIIFAAMVLSVCIGALRFHRFRPFREVFAPFYAIAMCVYSVYGHWTNRDYILLAIVVALGILIGALQSARSEVEYRTRREGDSPQPYVRDYAPYILGWLMLFGVGVLMYYLVNHITPVSAEQARSIARTVWQSRQPWYMWALYGAAGITYYLYVNRRVKESDQNERPV